MSLKVVWGIVMLVNISAFISMLLDKYYAVKGKWRISEFFLLSHGFLSGGIGLLMAMIIGRHKLSKVKFRVIATLGAFVDILILTILIFQDQIVASL